MSVSASSRVKGRRWLAGLHVALEERQTVDAAMRQIDFLDAEIAPVERLIAQVGLWSPEIRRLLSVPGLNVIVASSFLAAIGDIPRFQSPRERPGYVDRRGRVRSARRKAASACRARSQGTSSERVDIVIRHDR